ncbi:hypothetical protein [Methylobacterium sp. E-045]|uniref:hypothetical protein n=1 Tax=Methylobacterium sp. E-045 TaxID=2836575 RepID=UPI001FBB7D1B|nr:hypothetical protein [Methylobacterium sp. E-045]MCJ2130843.1 hypothetical protein [Methylobacterium sp. E-045]
MFSRICPIRTHGGVSTFRRTFDLDRDILGGSLLIDAVKGAIHRENKLDEAGHVPYPGSRTLSAASSLKNSMVMTIVCRP